MFIRQKAGPEHPGRHAIARRRQDEGQDRADRGPRWSNLEGSIAMTVTSKSLKLLLLATLAGSAAGGLAAQKRNPPSADLQTSVHASPESQGEMTPGPEVRGIISARTGRNLQVTAADGSRATVAIDDNTRIKASSGLFGLNRSKLAEGSLLNGLPVTIRTLQSADGLVASQINLQNKDLRTASMIHNGTDQRFVEQTAATEALRGRMGDIDQYNVKATTNVNFDTGQSALSAQAKNDLCATATSAERMNNALLLVVGYTDSTGSQEFNQVLSEKRASRVVNYLQQNCGWKPYRMLTPTGMSEADPAAPNDTVDGKAQNRRVAVNVLVSKAVDGL
jgi:OmpA-OmpF porin, OOP family